ncbi:hypothetical protein HPSD74_0803 [Glaesserella parasuis D74]|nr:hypothetical protein HPSD74_0803 [Glaesserella parasuis D74]
MHTCPFFVENMRLNVFFVFCVFGLFALAVRIIKKGLGARKSE